MEDKNLEKIINRDNFLLEYLGKHNYPLDSLENWYNGMKQDIKELKKQYGEEIVSAGNNIHKWELELLKKNRAVKEREGSVLILVDRIPKDKTKFQSSPFRYFVLRKLIEIYKERLAMAREIDGRASLGDQGYEKQKEERVGKIRQSIKGMLDSGDSQDEFSIPAIEESAKKGNKEAEEEKAENPRDKEYCRDHKKAEEDEIDVSKLSL